MSNDSLTITSKYSVQDGDLDLLVPGVVVDEFERDRERIEQSMTTTVAARFKELWKDPPYFRRLLATLALNTAVHLTSVITWSHWRCRQH